MAGELTPEKLAELRRIAEAGVWRPIPGWPYEVSSVGQVRTISSKRPIKPSIDPKGYLKVTLQQNGRRLKTGLSSVVLMAFVGERPDGYHAAHLNGDKTNNSLSNLAWVSQSENESHKRLHGTALLGERHPASVLTREAVECIKARYIPRHAQHGALALAREFGCSSISIRHAISGKTWQHLPLAQPQETGR